MDLITFAASLGVINSNLPFFMNEQSRLSLPASWSSVLPIRLFTNSSSPLTSLALQEPVHHLQHWLRALPLFLERQCELLQWRGRHAISMNLVALALFNVANQRIACSLGIGARIGSLVSAQASQIGPLFQPLHITISIYGSMKEQ